MYVRTVLFINFSYSAEKFGSSVRVYSFVRRHKRDSQRLRLLRLVAFFKRFFLRYDTVLVVRQNRNRKR